MPDDLFDFSVYMDSAPLTITSNSPLELLHQFFTKLGARYVVVNDTDGFCKFFPFSFSLLGLPLFQLKESLIRRLGLLSLTNLKRNELFTLSFPALFLQCIVCSVPNDFSN